MYKKLIVSAFVLLSTLSLYAQNKSKSSSDSRDLTEWKDNGIFEQNVIYPRANVIPYSNESAIESWKYNESAYYVSLNGSWQFDVQPSVSSRPNPELKNFSAVGWKSTIVPSSQIVMDGKQIKSPKIKNPFDLPTKDNLVATYVREFEVPKTWKDYKAYLQIQARSACYVWINQEYVGYCEDSRTLSEFGISKHIKYGKTNTIAIQVIAVSTGSLLEMEQDRGLIGITGDVAICLKPEVNVQDYNIVSEYNSQAHMGTFSLSVGLENPKKSGQYYVEVELWNPKGNELERMGKWVVFDKKNELTTTIEREFAMVQPWTAETPILYTAVIRLRDKNMQLVETVGTRFAFRTTEVKDGVLQINQRPIKLRGVVYTGYDCDKNGMLSEDRMREDLRLMKQNNINAIRTAIYSPSNPRLYELCDEYGIYVVCDANIQPFSTQTKAVATDKEMVPHFVVRVQNMYERYKNHPCIVAWSLGNGVDNGICMENAYRALKQKDKHRPVLFAGAGYSENTDLVAESNLSPDDLKAYAVKQQTRPLVLFTYGSSQGNNYGGLEPLWKLVRNYSRLAGGFASVWNSYRSYDPISSKDKTVSGILNDRHQAVPYLEELRNLYRPFDVKMVSLVPDHAEFNVTNLLDFLSLGDYVLEYNIYSNLKPRIIEGEVNVDLNPGESKNFKLKVPKLTLYSGEELFIRFTIRQRSETNLVPKSSELGVFEFELPMNLVQRQPLPTYGREELYLSDVSQSQETTNNRIHIYNNNVDLWFDMDQAEITSLSVNDKELLAGAPRLNFWRPSTDNDLVDKNALRLWQNLNPDNMNRTVLAVNHRRIDKYTIAIDAMVRYTDPNGNLLFDVKQSYAVLYTGDILIDNKIVASEYVKAIPRVGYQFQINKSYNRVHWLGLDKETYCDRKQSGLMGTYLKPVDQMFFPYSRPQAAGNRADVHWVSVANATEGLFVDMIDSTFNFSVYPYSDKQLSSAANSTELKSQNYLTFNVDFSQSGIGSALGGVDLEDKAVLTNKIFAFRLHLHAYLLDQAEPMDFRRIRYPEIQSSVLPMPVIAKSRERFDAPMSVTLSSETPQSVIHYTIDGSTPNEKSPIYRNPFVINKSTIVQAKTYKKGATPSFVAAKRFNFDYITKAVFANKPNTPYNYNQETILFDGETAEIADLSQGWLGFSGNDFSVVFELGKTIELQDVVMHFAHVPDAWAFAPSQVAIYVSSDGEIFSAPVYAKIKYDPSSVEMNTPQLQTIKVIVEQPNVRYVKIVAKNLGRIPIWHKAKGLRPWLMIDEVQLNEVIK